MEGTRIRITKNDDKFPFTTDDFDNDTRVIFLRDDKDPAFTIVDHTIGVHNAGIKQTTIQMLIPDGFLQLYGDLQKRNDGLLTLKSGSRVTFCPSPDIKDRTDISEIVIFRTR